MEPKHGASIGRTRLHQPDAAGHLGHEGSHPRFSHGILIPKHSSFHFSFYYLIISTLYLDFGFPESLTEMISKFRGAIELDFLFLIELDFIVLRARVLSRVQIYCREGLWH